MGATFGSFLNVCIHRMPRGESIVTPPSHCGHCGHAVRWHDNLPLISYLLLRGRCRDCHKSFSIRYWIVELLTAILFVAVWQRFPPAPALACAVFVCGLIAASFIDFEHFIIPDEITIGGAVVGLLFSFAIPNLQHANGHFSSLLWSLGGALLGYGVLWMVVEAGKKFFGKKKEVFPEPTLVKLTSDGIVVGGESEVWENLLLRSSDKVLFTGREIQCGERKWESAGISVDWEGVRIQDELLPFENLPEISAKTGEIILPREAMGFGDVKFLAAIGAFLGPVAIFPIILISSLLGSAVGLTAILIGRKQWGAILPYGPYLAIAALIWLLGGSRWFGLYLDWLAGG